MSQQNNIDIFVMTIGGRFQGFIPAAAIFKGGPSPERVQEINRTYLPAKDGWIYHVDGTNVKKHHFYGVRK